MVIPREPVFKTLKIGRRRDYTRAPRITKAYLLGILHDATERHTTFRVSQKSSEFVEMVASGIRSLGGNAWTYKEGSSRNVFIVEFSKSFLRDFEIVSKRDKIDYIRGYFDTDGGVAKSSNVRFYIYFAQKDFSDLDLVRNYLVEIGLDCGVIHNPSKRTDPEYWRFFVKAKSYVDFVQKIGSWHPDKSKYLWMKI